MSDNSVLSVKILAVEDDTGDYGLIRVYLRMAGYIQNIVPDPVTWVTTLAQAEQQVVLDRPDIILLDLSLPDSFGISTVKRMRMLLPTVPIIVLSGNNDNDIALAALEEGAQDYVIKGQYEHNALGKAISHALIRAKLEAKLIESEFRWKFAIEGSGDGLWDWDVAQNIVFYSERWKQMLGYAENEVGNGLDEWEMRIHPDDKAGTLASVQAYLSGKSSSYLSEHRVLSKDGDYKWILDRGMVVARDAEGHPIRLIGTHTDITERKRMEDQVRQLAFYDPLTQLPNRRLLNDRLSRAMSAGKRSGGYGALMFLDLDNFKPINDTHDHILTIEAANRLRACVREIDTVARFCGDEFVVMLSELDTNEQASTIEATRVAEKILACLSTPYQLTVKHEGQPDTEVEYHCTTSIGLVLFLGHEICQDDIIICANAAMYQARHAGRNTIRFYQAE